MNERMLKARQWWHSDVWQRLEVEALNQSMAVGADWDELEEWEQECVCQYVEQL